MCFHLDEPNGLLYIGTLYFIFTISVPSFGERRATRIFSLVRIWALVQARRAYIPPCAGFISVREANVYEVLSRVMRLRWRS